MNTRLRGGSTIRFIPDAALGDPERQQLMRLGGDLELAWSHPSATAATRKRILRAALNEIGVGSAAPSRSFSFAPPSAIDGRLPRGFGVKRLMDLPMDWTDQWSALGLRAPAER